MFLLMRGQVVRTTMGCGRRARDPNRFVVTWPLAAPALRAYREQFSPSRSFPHPHAMLAVGVVIGETADHAAQLMRIAEIGFSHLVAGRPYQMPTLEEALRTEIDPVDRARAQGFLGNWSVGDAASVAGEVRVLADETGADEVMLTTALPNAMDRIRTIEAMARTWGVTAPDREPVVPVLASR